jgi:hypothetical protein
LGGGAGRLKGKASKQAALFEKSAQKLLLMGPRAFQRHGLKAQSFFCFFFVHKKEDLSCLRLCLRVCLTSAV